MDTSKLWLAAVISSSLAIPARASDWYVDAVHGSDSNPGTSPAFAWRTITCALNNVPAYDVERVFVAPGRYDEALGEEFPIRMRSRVQLIGAGPETTEIVNTLPPTLFPGEAHFGVITFRAPVPSGVPNIAPGTRLSGFHIRSTLPMSLMPYPDGVWLESYWGRVTAELRDLVIDSFYWGIRAEGFATLDMSRVDLKRNGGGLLLQHRVHCTGSEIRVVGNGTGIYCWGFYGTDHTLSLTRSRIEGNSVAAIYAWAMPNPHGPFDGKMQLKLVDCVITRNGYAQSPYGGCLRLGADQDASGAVHIERCSIFDNWRGIDSISGVNNTARIRLTIDSSLLQNQDYDLLGWEPFMTVSYSNIADGHFQGINGNISAPALFVDPAAHDYRLRFDSPGIDVGNPAIPAGTLDFLGMPRSIDGDLDTHERADIGVFEFAPLVLKGSGRIGTPLDLECWGPVGALAVVRFARKPLVAVPLSTIYGQLDLDPTHIGLYGNSTVGQSAPVIFQRMIPDSPALIGHTFSFQSRTTSALAPYGAAYTNGVQFTVAP